MLRFILLLGMMGMMLTAHGQVAKKSVALRQTMLRALSTVEKYTDSLALFRRQQDSLSRYLLLRDSLVRSGKLQDGLDSLGNLVKIAPHLDMRDGKPMKKAISNIACSPLFLPPTFYKRVPHGVFDLEGDLTAVDHVLLNLYLHRPDLIGRTETQLTQAGDIIEALTMKVEQATDIVEHVAPKPKEALPAPVDLLVLKPNFWSYSGDYYLQFLQNYISSNWYQGGESNYSMVGSITLNANYNNKQKVRWDNKLEMKLGLQTARQDTVHSLKATENLLRLTSKLGLQASKKWYYTLQMIGYTQIMRQWNSNSDVVTTDFMGPLNVNVSIGMDYNIESKKGKVKGSVHIAPFAYNFRYVNRAALATRYGLEADKRQLHNYGSQFTFDMTWKIVDNFSWKTRYYAYTTYERSEMTWENTFSFRFSKWISTNVFVYPRFDDSRARDDHYGYFQLKEYASLGFSYSF
ncbi:MAG: DUF3078 domain-containing protein [Prevotellaceae bacterium]|nr:DUF3078 domain-containing protein [Prevotellaceae bacterium]